MNLPYPVCQVNPILTDVDKAHLEEFELLPQDKKIPLEKLMGLIAVSYTHLDVYKRQDREIIMEMKIK